MSSTIKDKKIIIISIVAMFFISFGITYAYFSVGLVGESNNQTVTTGTLSLNFLDGTAIDLNNIYPGAQRQKTFHVTNTGTLDTYYKIGWNNLSNEILNNEMMISYTCTSYLHYGEENEEVSGTCDSLLSKPIGNDATTPVVEGIHIASGITHLYDLTIEFIELSSEQNYNQGKNFSAVLEITESSAWYDRCTNDSNDIKCKILNDNLALSNVKSDENIDFSYDSEGTRTIDDEWSAETEPVAEQITNGLYYTTDLTKTENSQRVYYFRGAVENNYLIFGGFCWRIVRTVEDGSVRLVYGGTPASGVCPQTGTTASITKTRYNSTYGDNAYVGYMMGIDNQCAGNTACSGTTKTISKLQAQTNTYSSNIKKVIDAWFAGGTTSNSECYDGSTFSNCNFTSLGTNSLSNNSSLIADTPYCNDRSITAEINNLGFGTNKTEYAGFSRLTSFDNSNDLNLFTNQVEPTYKCAQNNDRFTVSSTLGNESLTNPIGLLTADEITYAGVSCLTYENYTNYLYSIEPYWTMSASVFVGGRAGVFGVFSVGGLSNFNVNIDDRGGVRPALRSEATVTGGTGEYDSPYVIE